MIVIGEKKELRGVRLAEQRGVKRKANILTGILVLCMLFSIALLIASVGYGIYIALLHPIDALIVLAWIGGFFFTVWILVNYVFADAIAYIIARALAPYFAKQVIEGMNDCE